MKQTAHTPVRASCDARGPGLTWSSGRKARSDPPVAVQGMAQAHKMQDHNVIRLVYWSTLIDSNSAIAGVLCTRLPTAFLVTSHAGFTLKERAFIALTWVPKVLKSRTAFPSCRNVERDSDCLHSSLASQCCIPEPPEIFLLAFSEPHGQMRAPCRLEQALRHCCAQPQRGHS